MSAPLPAVTVIMTTWAPAGPVGASRIESGSRALRSWLRHLHYDGTIALHVADDGSTHDVDPADVFASIYYTERDETQWSGLMHATRQERRGVGASLNAGMRSAFHQSPIVLYAVDDWELVGDIDITPWARLLQRDGSMAVVRLGPPHPDLSGTVEMTPHGWCLRLDRHHFAFGHRPALYHQRLVDHYGWFDEGESAYECERLYNERYCARQDGPDVVYALPYPWRHIGEAEVGDISPGALSN